MDIKVHHVYQFVWSAHSVLVRKRKHRTTFQKSCIFLYCYCFMFSYRLSICDSGDIEWKMKQSSVSVHKSGWVRLMNQILESWLYYYIFDCEFGYRWYLLFISKIRIWFSSSDSIEQILACYIHPIYYPGSSLWMMHHLVKNNQILMKIFCARVCVWYWSDVYLCGRDWVKCMHK